MRLDLKRLGFWRIGLSVLAGLMVLFVLLASLAAASPPLHRWLHKHSDTDGDHHPCVVCAFAQGRVNTSETLPIVVFLPLTRIFEIYRADTAPKCSPDRRLAPTRAPPPA
jgi:hypothetical protein